MLAFFLSILIMAAAQAPSRTVDGKPNLQGYWNNQAGSAPWDIEPHAAAFQIPAGQGVITDTPDRKIPYKPEALAKRNDFRDNHAFDDPQGHCAPSGIPRQTYTPFGFQILQPRGAVVILYEAEHAYRVIRTDGSPHIPASIELWQGDSIGHWEGNTLVADVTNFNGRTWFDMMGNFTTPSLHVVERYSLVDANTIQYEARIEDPAVYTRPWTMSFPIRRNSQPGYYMLEFACHEGERDLQHYTPDTGNKEK
ncbi:MAG: hypothetical protein HY646_21410 [Acidobacteria bacterium]|nr:hypothetical protein [Acidobacteriota bacterium]